MALVLASASDALVVGHVLHDLRPREHVEADAQAAQALAARLGLPFVSEEVRVRAGRGNAEARARAARYAALDRMAAEAGCPFVAVGHHRDDQAETVMMGLLRGAGPRGLAGVIECRPLPHSTLIRPLLGTSREACHEICRDARWQWREDATNADASLLRGAVRLTLLPAAERLRPGASERMARTALLFRDAWGLLQERVETVWRSGQANSNGRDWERAGLRAERPLVIGELLRVAAGRLCGARGLDRMGSRTLDQVVRAVIDEDRHPREFSVGGLRITVRWGVVRVQGDDRDG